MILIIRRPLLVMVVALIFGEIAVLSGISTKWIIIEVILVAVACGFGLFVVLSKSFKQSFVVLFKSVKQSSVVPSKSFSKRHVGWLKVAAICLLSVVSGVILCTKQQRIFDKYDELQYNSDVIQNIIGVMGTVKSIEHKNYQYILCLETDEGVVMVYIEQADNIRYGEELKVVGNILPMGIGDNPGNYDERQHLHSKGVILKIQASHYMKLGDEDDYNYIAQKLNDARTYFSQVLEDIATEEERGVISAMVLGESSVVDGEIKELYSINGISHLISISGLHVSVIGMSLYKLLRMRFRYLSCALVSAGVMIMFLVLTGSAVSAMRAVIMFVTYVTADVLGRKYDMISAVSLAAVLLLVDNPAYILNSSFQLSFGAMVSVCVIWPQSISFFKVEKKLVKTLLFNLALTFTLMPLNSRLFYRLPTYSPIINLIVVPFTSILLLMSVLGIFAGMWVPELGQFFLGTAVYILRFYKEICYFFSDLPFSSIVTGNIEIKWLVVSYICIGIMVLIMSKKTWRQIKWLVGVISLAVIMLIIVYDNKVDSFYMCFLDVGQGDSTYIHSASGNDYLIDCGSTDENAVGEYKLESFLEYMDVDKLEYVFVSHVDTDHISGIMELIERKLIDIEYLVMPEISGELVNDKYIQLRELAECNEIKIIYISEGYKITDGELSFTCISPESEEKYGDVNDSSMVLLMKYKELGTVFTGDISQTVEKELVPQVEQFMEGIQYSVLKVAHHGSKGSSDEEFLKAVNPDVAVISCGEDNSYGHPHEETLLKLEAVSSRVLRTDEYGAIIVEIEREIEVRSWKKPTE